jgi:hypothetical protein
MKRPTRIIPALLAMACVMAATATAAQAITIEPLNKSFESKAVKVSISGGSFFECRFTVSGKTNSTKTDYVNVTPTFKECEDIYPSVTYTNTSTCETGHSVPWTWTLNEGTSPYKGTTTVNCVGKFTFGTVCTVEIVRQTAPSNKLIWEAAGENSWLALSEEKLKYIAKQGSACKLLGYETEGTLSLRTPEFELEGIKAV